MPLATGYFVLHRFERQKKFMAHCVQEHGDAASDLKNSE
jgi:hypothetical protein